MEAQKLLVFDPEIISELSTFIERSGSYQADEGYNDDLAMCLVLFGWVTTNTFFSDLTNVNVREGLYNSEMRAIENDLTPFGIIDDGQQQEMEVMGGDLWLFEEPKLLDL